MSPTDQVKTHSTAQKRAHNVASVPRATQKHQTRARILDAVIRCLDRVGYSETSINRVQHEADVSRGALTHHFPNKEALMVAALERLLDPVRGRQGDDGVDGIARVTGRGDGVDRDIVRLWTRVVDTAQGRALLEIVIASRTDSALGARIAPALVAYNTEISDNITALYAGHSDEDVVLLWAICRAFLRGLHTHAPFEADRNTLDRMITRFGEMMAAHLTTRKDTPDE